MPATGAIQRPSVQWRFNKDYEGDTGDDQLRAAVAAVVERVDRVGQEEHAAAARHALLAREGWDVERQGLFGAPPIDVVIPDELHSTLFKVLGMLGLGTLLIGELPLIWFFATTSDLKRKRQGD